MTKQQTYLLDGKPISWTELINEAKYLDDDFRATFFRSTSAAAQVLRANGHTVTQEWINTE